MWAAVTHEAAPEGGPWEPPVCFPPPADKGKGKMSLMGPARQAGGRALKTKEQTGSRGPGPGQSGPGSHEWQRDRLPSRLRGDSYGSLPLNPRPSVPEWVTTPASGTWSPAKGTVRVLVPTGKAQGSSGALGNL